MRTEKRRKQILQKKHGEFVEFCLIRIKPVYNYQCKRYWVFLQVSWIFWQDLDKTCQDLSKIFMIHDTIICWQDLEPQVLINYFFREHISDIYLTYLIYLYIFSRSWKVTFSKIFGFNIFQNRNTGKTPFEWLILNAVEGSTNST